MAWDDKFIGCGITGNTLIAPQENEPLLKAITTLKEQFSSTGDVRTAMVPADDQVDSIDRCGKYWQILYGEHSPWKGNSDGMTIRIIGDRIADTTQIIVTKNGYQRDITYSSTWPTNENINLYLGLDDITEEFTITSITLSSLGPLCVFIMFTITRKSNYC